MFSNSPSNGKKPQFRPAFACMENKSTFNPSRPRSHLMAKLPSYKWLLWSEIGSCIVPTTIVRVWQLQPFKDVGWNLIIFTMCGGNSRGLLCRYGILKTKVVLYFEMSVRRRTFPLFKVFNISIAFFIKPRWLCPK